MTDHMVALEAALDAVTDERDAARREVVAITAERDALRRIGVQVADMIDRGYTPGHALARCLGLSLALTDREMAGALRGLCGVQHG